MEYTIGFSFNRIVLNCMGLSLLQISLIEFVHRGSLISTLFWSIQHPVIFVFNYGLILTCCLFFVFLLGSSHGGLILSTIVMLLLSTTSAIKEQLLGEPLFPWDFRRIDQLLNLLPKYVGEILVVLIGLIFSVTFLIVFTKKIIPRETIRWVPRIVVVCCILVIPTVFYSTRLNPSHNVMINIQTNTDVQTNTRVELQNMYSKQKGFLLNFTLNLEKLSIAEPPSYSRENIERIIEQYDLNQAIFTQTVSPVTTVSPNIIIVLNEAFWDPTELQTISFTQDPIRNFRELAKSNISGTLLSPVYGGGTANVEFEILTGLNVKYLPQGVIAYQQYLERPLDSLATILKDQGYSTVAIHPYHDWFYKRKQVYPLLGFDTFLNIKDFKNPEIRGDYISDLEVSHKIIQQIEQLEKPGLILAVTMQNHAPYSPKRYQENHIKVSGSLSQEGKDILETYIQGLQDADQSLKTLTDYFRESEEPTIICFLGDHLPYLGKEYMVYKQAGYIAENEGAWTSEENVKMKAVPYMIWTNYMKESSMTNVKNKINPDQLQYNKLILPPTSLLGNYLLEITGIESTTPVFQLGRTRYNRLLQRIKPDNINHKDHNLPSIFDNNKLEEDYWLLQYDLLFGKQYCNSPSQDSNL